MSSGENQPIALQYLEEILARQFFAECEENKAALSEQSEQEAGNQHRRHGRCCITMHDYRLAIDEIVWSDKSAEACWRIARNQPDLEIAHGKLKATAAGIYILRYAAERTYEYWFHLNVLGLLEQLEMNSATGE